jgi:DNA replication and repair protein RecF
MALTRLSLSDFRNHADAVLSPGPGFVVLTGDNGAGKTNILEAVSLLAPGRGLRRAALPSMARQAGAGGFGVAAQLDGDSELATGIEAAEPDRRIIRINGAAKAATALSEWLSVIWLTPAMDRIFNDSAGDRRRFLDRLVLALEPTHARHSARYEAAMRQRNRLLADGGGEASWMTALEAQMAEHGLALAEARARMVVLLNAGLAEAPEGHFPRAHVALEGWALGDLAADLRDSRPRDIAASRTLVGPHRIDMIVTHSVKAQPAAQSSTGEQKALLLGIILAHAALLAAQTTRPPILLLDEVAAHLDPARRAALFERLSATRSQVWMTGTEPSLFDAIGDDASRFTVRDGQIA